MGDGQGMGRPPMPRIMCIQVVHMRQTVILWDTMPTCTHEQDLQCLGHVSMLKHMNSMNHAMPQSGLHPVQSGED